MYCLNDGRAGSDFFYSVSSCASVHAVVVVLMLLSASVLDPCFELQRHHPARMHVRMQAHLFVYFNLQASSYASKRFLVYEFVYVITLLCMISDVLPKTYLFKRF